MFIVELAIDEPAESAAAILSEDNDDDAPSLFSGGGGKFTIVGPGKEESSRRVDLETSCLLLLIGQRLTAFVVFMLRCVLE